MHRAGGVVPRAIALRSHRGGAEWGRSQTCDQGASKLGQQKTHVSDKRFWSFTLKHTKNRKSAKAHRYKLNGPPSSAKAHKQRFRRCYLRNRLSKIVCEGA